MAVGFWSFMKRSPSSSSATPSYSPSYTSSSSNKLHRMAPGLAAGSPTGSSGSTATGSTANGDDGYHSFLSDVLVVGAGPAGLMLADNLVRFGIHTRIIDDRPDRTSTGRADGLQPKSLETLRQMRLCEPLLRKGAKIYDIAFWKSTPDQTLHRTGREIHYPAVVDLLDPYILLVHQGMVESVFLDDLKERGVEVVRDTQFTDYEHTPRKARPLSITCSQHVTRTQKTYGARYLVGCDGAHSRVRKAMPNAVPIGASSDAVWGVLDGVLDTDFPDIWSKVVVQSEDLGSVLMIPRERNMTRLYIELKPGSVETTMKERHTQEYVQKRAQEIMHPYRLDWKTVEWFGRYQIGQRVASRFSDDDHRVFIAGDASHTHSPKAAQGMNTSMHDSYNLAWKLNFAIRGLSKPSLLETYELERKKIAEDLIKFDYEHANAFAAGDSDALAANFSKHVSFISGYGVTYEPNVLNLAPLIPLPGLLKPGFLLPPAKVTRFIDANPVDIQTDIPALGQFRIYFFAKNIHAAMPFLDTVCAAHLSPSSYAGRITMIGNASYTMQPPLAAPHDEFVCPERYTPMSAVFTYALVSDTPRGDLELDFLPQLLRDSRWTVYLDDAPHMDTRGQTCMDKWLGGVREREVVVAVVRPDGYVGAVGRWGAAKEDGTRAVEWLDGYLEGFMRDT